MAGTPAILGSAARLALLSFALALAGCGIPPSAPLATDIDPKLATPDYWWDQPVQVRVPAPSFDRAFAAAETVLRQRFFEVDLSDPRRGILLSRPTTASQWFEPWRQDNTTAGHVSRASVATYRRTVRFDVERTEDDRFLIQPRVLVERQALVGRRVSAVVGFRSFTAIDQSSLTAITEEGSQAPASYWYAVGRDYNLEVALGHAIVDAMY